MPPPTFVCDFSTCVTSDLDRYITQAFDQIMYDGCEPALNRDFWSEYKTTRGEIKNELMSAGIRYTAEYYTLLRVKTVRKLETSGWIGYYNPEGCIEFQRDCR